MSAGRKKRDHELDLFEMKGRQLLHFLRGYANAWCRKYDRPISANELYPLLEEVGYSGHPSIMGAVFRRSAGWVPVGFTNATEPGKHHRMIRLWLPVDMAEAMGVAA